MSTIRQQIMSDAVRYAHPAESRIEKCWMDPQRRSPQRLTGRAAEDISTGTGKEK